MDQNALQRYVDELDGLIARSVRLELATSYRLKRCSRGGLLFSECLSITKVRIHVVQAVVACQANGFQCVDSLLLRKGVLLCNSKRGLEWSLCSRYKLKLLDQMKLVRT